MGNKKIKKEATEKKGAQVRKETRKDGKIVKVEKHRTEDEIEELFASRKKEKGEDAIDAAKKKKSWSSSETTAKVQAIAKDNDDEFADSRGLKKKRRPTTDEGYPIYSAIELKVGQGGDTPDCPFECDCCF